MIDVLWLPGTGFSSGPDGISAEFGRRLDPTRFRFRVLRYPASYGGFAPSYADSREAGMAELITAVSKAPGRVVVGGYSQGAGIAGDLAEGSGRVFDGKVVACALISDPSRPPGAGMPGRPVASGYGISGARGSMSVPTWWAAAEGDPITALPEGNPLRSIADMSEYFSFQSPGDAHRWMESLADRCRRNAWQRWWSPENWRTWGGAMAYARGYLVDGKHTTDYLLHGHAQALAETVNREVRS
ncbi:alpha/beta fold hydrolase [Nocardia cyriacigeorgica]|uniref:Alpha/beta fold hydrolase n=1 Tax=Nocardia cyriacigeorgica TaxID=135487 RepID=A0A6P1CML6_9NOCA|nr:alpha/beta fold hydrolase [Nocardia cyriacigeorgica]NEW33810.1 alpha/beta fold hydrolase [Nocardia cyriacigeorgica]